MAKSFEATETNAVRLCRGSASTRPLECFELGEAETSLSESDLVELCAAMVIASPLRVLHP